MNIIDRRTFIMFGITLIFFQICGKIWMHDMPLSLSIVIITAFSYSIGVIDGSSRKGSSSNNPQRG
jgi:uncharacterized membrane protein YcaP (DUF421 family)